MDGGVVRPAGFAAGGVCGGRRGMMGLVILGAGDGGAGRRGEGGVCRCIPGFTEISKLIYNLVWFIK